ncbi:MAG: methylmalonyl Co-A mutase-associated GTPase MeaB [Thermoanaerobaculaceae bacterium]|nr:methylmalonyl Co-A mutase-associated GTPase MeaB [Thermoanaerobaculaceae bacterium]
MSILQRDLKDTRKLSRILSLVENRQKGYTEILKECFLLSGKSKVVGITGPPGAGKSTLTSTLIGHLRKEGACVAVLAIDPSSSFSGGAILGDRIRMLNHSLDTKVYIRSAATRGAMGGLCPAASDMITVLDAAGFDYILVETVGVGQDEIDVVRETDTVLLVLVPGLGDDIQALKAGIMEIADIFVVNKSDREGSNKLVNEIEYILSLSQSKKEWNPPVLKTVASKNEGINELIFEIKKHLNFLESTSLLAEKRKTRAALKLRRLLLEGLENRIRNGPLKSEEERKLMEAFLRKEKDPYSVAEEIVESVILEELQ